LIVTVLYLIFSIPAYFLAVLPNYDPLLYGLYLIVVYVVVVIIAYILEEIIDFYTVPPR